MRNVIQFTRIRDVKAPNRANSNDAGMDFFIPNYTESFLIDLQKKNENNKVAYAIKKNEAGDEYLEIILSPFAQVNIPSGIRVNILDKGTYLDANNKSGVATKYRLDVGAKVIDADYQGEVHLNLINTSDEYITLTSGQKIVQFIHKEYIKTRLIEISPEDYDNIPTSDRGTGGFASTGEK